MDCSIFPFNFHIRQIQENIAKAIMAADTMSPNGIQAWLDELQKELIQKANSKQDYDAIADGIFTLREQKSQAEADTRCREETRKRIAELQDFIGSQRSDIAEFNEQSRPKADPADYRLRRPVHRGIQVRDHNRYRGIKRLLTTELNQ